MSQTLTSYSDDKSTTQRIELVPSSPSLEDGQQGYVKDAHLEKKVLFKLDLWLMPTMCVIFIFLFLDRANIGNARVAGLQRDLKLSDSDYQIALMVTYIPYVLVELFSNFLLKIIGPRVMIPSLCVMWGIVTLLQCRIQNFAGLLACRFFLGLCEGPLFPSFVLYLSGFYRRQELQKRIGCIYGAASVSGAFSGLLAAAIQKLDQKGGIEGWRWIFLLEGAATVVFGLFSSYVLTNTPEQVRILKPDEALYAQQRMVAEMNAHENPKITLRAVLSTFRDLHVLNMSLIGFANGVVIGGLSYFTPSIVQALGYDTVQTQLLSVPPYAIAFVFTMTAAFFADRYKRRGLVAISTLLFAIIGSALNLTGTSIAVRYTALCLMVASIYSTAPSLLTWVPNNSAGYARRCTAVSIVFVTSNGAGMVAMWLYPTSTAPRYLFATKFNLTVICIEILLISLQIYLLSSANKKKRTNRDQILAGLENLTMEEQMEILGDHHPDYEYVL